MEPAFRWMIQRSGGGDFLVLRAAGDAQIHPYLLGLGGLDSVETLLLRTRQASWDPFVLERVRRAEAIFLAGGDQSRYLERWKDTPLQEALNQAAARGVPIGGTSAGLAVLGEFCFSARKGSVTPGEAMADPADPQNRGFDDPVEEPRVPLPEEGQGVAEGIHPPAEPPVASEVAPGPIRPGHGVAVGPEDLEAVAHPPDRRVVGPVPLRHEPAQPVPGPVVADRAVPLVEFQPLVPAEPPAVPVAEVAEAAVPALDPEVEPPGGDHQVYGVVFEGACAHIHAHLGILRHPGHVLGPPFTPCTRLRSRSPRGRWSAPCTLAGRRSGSRRRRPRSGWSSCRRPGPLRRPGWARRWSAR